MTNSLPCFAGDKLTIVDPNNGEIKNTEVFIAILGASQLTYIEAVMTQQKEDLIAACENALHYYGGVPMAIVTDNLKSAVVKSSRYEPTINEFYGMFRAFKTSMETDELSKYTTDELIAYLVESSVGRPAKQKYGATANGCTLSLLSFRRRDVLPCRSQPGS